MMRPTFKVHEEEIRDDYGKFIIEPLEKGYGHTLGNALRRVLLTSLPGAALTVVKIEGVRHQFSTMTGLKEDIVTLLLNLKKIRLSIAESIEEEVVLKLIKQGPGEVTAADIELPAGVTIVNPELYIGTLGDKKARLDIEMKAQRGYGYETADEKKVTTVGYIPVDSLYTPVTRVNYTVEATRVGRMTNLDKLVIEIWTDKTITPRKTLEEAAKILVAYATQIYAPQEEVAQQQEPTVNTNETVVLRIEELDIPTRIVNALENGGIETVEQLQAMKREELVKIKNLGAKSLSIIEERLKERGIVLSEV